MYYLTTLHKNVYNSESHLLVSARQTHRQECFYVYRPYMRAPQIDEDLHPVMHT